MNLLSEGRSEISGQVTTSSPLARGRTLYYRGPPRARHSQSQDGEFVTYVNRGETVNDQKLGRRGSPKKIGLGLPTNVFFPPSFYRYGLGAGGGGLFSSFFVLCDDYRGFLWVL